MKNKNNNNQKLLKTYGKLSDNKLVGSVQWFKLEPKFVDIRKFYVDKESGDTVLTGGISLDRSEAKKLHTILGKLLDGEDMEDTDDEEDDRESVDFQEIFDSSSGIIEKRKSGMTTVNGFIQIKLTKYGKERFEKMKQNKL